MQRSIYFLVEVKCIVKLYLVTIKTNYYLLVHVNNFKIDIILLQCLQYINIFPKLRLIIFAYRTFFSDDFKLIVNRHNNFHFYCKLLMYYLDLETVSISLHTKCRKNRLLHNPLNMKDSMSSLNSNWPNSCQFQTTTLNLNSNLYGFVKKCVQFPEYEKTLFSTPCTREYFFFFLYNTVQRLHDGVSIKIVFHQNFTRRD